MSRISDLLDRAKAATGLENFGDDGFREGLEILVDSADRVLGILTRSDMIAAFKERGPETPIVDVMHADVPLVRPDDPFDEAFRVMQECNCPALPVVDRLGRFVGLITMENVGELMLINSLRPTDGRPAWRMARHG